jgi:hypothetical protein
MKKPTLETALARTQPPEDAEPSPATKPAKIDDGNVATSLRIKPDLLAELKVLAVQRCRRVHDVILGAIENYLALNGRRAAA